MKALTVLAALALATSLSHADHHKGGEWTNLIDGSFEGWVDGAGKPVKAGKWTVQDGILHLSGKGGGSIYTARDYGDFELSFRWKIAPKGNSGVKYRMAKYAGKGLLGPEYQVYDDGSKATGKGSTASLYDIVAPDPKTKTLKPVGEWNTSRIVAKGGHIQHFLNDKKVIDITVGTPEWKAAVGESKFAKLPAFAENASGPIMLQDHGSAVWFSTLKIREL